MGEILPSGGQISTEVTGILDEFIDNPDLQATSDVLRRAIAVQRHNRDRQKSAIDYPYMPEEGEIKYVSADNDFMQLAKIFAKVNSYDAGMPNCSVVVKDGKILGLAANGSDFHDKHGCERKRRGSKTGEDYHLCEG